MIHECKGCSTKFESKVSRVNYCNDCRENGVSFICVVCGEKVTLKTESHRIYLRNPKHIWRCQRCASVSPEAKAKRKASVQETYANMPDDHPVKVNARKRMKSIHKDPDIQAKRLKTVRSDEFREHMRKSAIKQFSDPAKREQARQTSLKQWEDPEFRKLQAKINEERWAEGSPSRVKASETRLALWQDSTYRARMEEAIRKSVRRPEVRAKIASAITELMKDPSRRAELSKTLTEYWSQEEVREEARKRMAEYYASPEAKLRIAKGKIQAFADKEVDEKTLEIVEESIAKYSYEGGFIRRYSEQGAEEFIKNVRLNSRNPKMWHSLIADIVVVKGACTRHDLAKLTGYAYSSIVTIVDELALDGVETIYSEVQSSVADFVRSIYAGEILENCRPEFMRGDSGKSQELDIYLPDASLAIEVNGTYWHSEQAGKGKYYHFDKSKLCRENNVRLIHVWEHEWYDDRKRPILESIIRSALGLSKRIYARKLKVEYRPSSSMREFYDTNNIQGFRGGEFSICLVDPDTNQVVMAYNIGKGSHMSRKYQYEVIRGASLLNHTVVGGSSKLLFALFNSKEHDVRELVYYIDYNYFDGRSLKNDPRWELKSEQVSFKNYWVKTGEVKNREPKRHKEITEKYKTGEVLKLWNAGTATYLYRKD